MIQHSKILNKLSDGNWHCSSEFYALFIADPRTRICELKKLGYQLEDRRCQQHNFHEGGNKEWRLVGKTTSLNAPQAPQNFQSVSNPIARAFLERWAKKDESLKIKTLF